MNKKTKAIILAAGKGTRFYPLTKNCPKPFLKISGKTVLEHNLDQLNGLVKEAVLVIGYQGDKIKAFFGDRYKNLKISYVLQEEQLGTGHAAKLASSFIENDFLLLNGDDVYSQEDIKKCLNINNKKINHQFCILLKEVEDFSNFGVVKCSNDLVEGIIEKPCSDNKEMKLVNTGLYFLPKSIFDFQIEKSLRGEFEFTDYISQFIEKEKLCFQIADNWYPLSYPWNLLDANEFLLKNQKPFKKGKIEKNCTIKGKIIIKEGSLIKSGSYIEGPVYIGKNSIIGPNCYLRGPLSIGDNCLVAQSAEVKNSIINNNSKVLHSSFVRDAVIGENCDIGSGTVIANLRFDGKSVKVTIKGNEVDTGRERFGCVMGDNSRTGINCSLMPGVVIGEKSVVGPDSLVLKNVPDNTLFYNKIEEKQKDR